uniref:NAD(P)-dependent oxidoreductase n=1 Tax=Haloprofundus sp. MHR1 TaxID=2572921 RepID=UPI001F1DCD91|nr:NAD(P)-dependent oxidoreductase [Haloprofundus sp. MHR1]
MPETVGIVGLGNIGGRIAEVLADAYSVVVFDIDPARVEALEQQGASGADSAAAVGERADIVFLSLPGDGALHAATLSDDGVLRGLGAGDVLVDTSTVSPAASERVADACQAADVEFLDAPVSGGARNAERGTLTVLVGGSDETVERVRPVLETISETIHHVGPTGVGVTLKVVNNYVLGLNQLVLFEALSMARAAGIDDETFARTLADSSGASYALDRDMERFVIPDEYDSEFTLSLMRKDVSLAESFAADNDVPLLLGGASGLYRIGEAMGYGELDASAIVKLYEALRTER